MCFDAVNRAGFSGGSKPWEAGAMENYRKIRIEGTCA